MAGADLPHLVNCTESGSVALIAWSRIGALGVVYMHQAEILPVRILEMTMLVCRVGLSILVGLAAANLPAALNRRTTNSPYGGWVRLLPRPGVVFEDN